VIGSVVITIILLAGLVIALVVLLRPRPSSGTEPVASEGVDLAVVEREVYEKLYGKRSTTVSAPVSLKPSPGAQADGSRGQKPSGKRRPRKVRRSREHFV
jgi:hypothetical protein